MKTFPKCLACLPVIAAVSAAFVLSSSTSCVTYNEECARFVENPEGLAGYLGGNINIARSSVRLEDNPIGQVVADAFYNAFNDRTDLKTSGMLPNAAITNGGSIREDGICESHATLESGILRRKTLRDILPYDNKVYLITITPKGLKDVLTHGLENYSELVPQGAYPQVSGIRVWADMNCLKSDTGNLIRRVELKERGCTGETGCYRALDLTDDSSNFYLVVDSFVFGELNGTPNANGRYTNLQGGDGYSFELKNNKIIEANSFNFDVVAKYFAATYPNETTSLSAQPENRLFLLKEEALCGQQPLPQTSGDSPVPVIADAGFDPALDAGVDEPDAGIEADSGILDEEDAGISEEDAALSEEDAGIPEEDAEIPEEDADAGEDADVPEADAEVAEEDAGEEPPSWP